MNVGQPTWSSTTVSASRSRASRSIVATKLPPCSPNSHDERTIACASGRRGGDGELARELRAAVGAERRGRRPTRRRARPRGRRRRSRSRPGRRTRPAAAAAAATWPAPAPLTAVAVVLVRLGAVDVGPGGAVDDRVGPRGGDRRVTARGVGRRRARGARAASTSWPARAAAAATSWPSMPAAPVTSRRIGVSGSSAASAHAQGERQLEARLGVVEPLAEEVAQLAQAIADGLRMHVERGRDGLDLPGPVEPRRERLGQPRAWARRRVRPAERAVPTRGRPRRAGRRRAAARRGDRPRRRSRQGAAPGRPRSAVRPRVQRRRRRRCAAKVAAARSYQEHAPPPATWRMPVAARSASATSAAARWPVKVGQPTWSSTTVSVVALAREAQHGGDEVARRARRTATRCGRSRARRGRRRRRRARRRAWSARRRRAARSGTTRRTARRARAVEHVVRGHLDGERAGGRRGGGDVAGARRR